MKDPKISAEALCQIGPRFADWEWAAWHRSFDAFDKLLANQEEIIQTIGVDAQGAEDEKFAHTYRSHVLRRLATIDASTLRASSNLMLDLSTVFVQPDVIEAPSLPEEIEALEQRLSLEEARASLLERLQAQTGGERVTAESVVREYPRCAIVGPPGSGKTTLLQHLLLAITKGDLSFGSSTPLIPVLVKVRQLNPQSLPPVDDLLQLTESRIFSGTRPGFMDRQFHAGNVVLLIDGMDEIVDE